jgi:hypothetical protein
MSAEFETIVEKTSFSGSPQTSWKMGETAYAKWFDNTSGKWERWSGSGAPTVAVSGGTLPVTLVGTSISGSVGITGSATLPVNVTSDIGKSITGSIGLSITGSSTVPVSVVKTFFASVTGGLTGSLWVPASGKSIRLKMYSLSTDTCGIVALMMGSGSTISYLNQFFMNATGSVAMNLVGCNYTGSVNHILFVSGSVTSNIAASAWGDEV